MEDLLHQQLEKSMECISQGKGTGGTVGRIPGIVCKKKPLEEYVIWIWNDPRESL